MANHDTQFVTLGVDREVFAVPVEAVVEILDMRPMFRIPEAPRYLAGLIDVRGRGVPVIDLRVKLGRSAVTPTETTRILVMDVALASRRIVLGLIADRVFEVMALDPETLEAPPDIGVAWQSQYIRGVGRRGADFVVVFDLPNLFANDEAAILGGAVVVDSVPDTSIALLERNAA